MRYTLPLPIGTSTHPLVNEVQVASMAMHNASCEGQMHSLVQPWRAMESQLNLAPANTQKNDRLKQYRIE